MLSEYASLPTSPPDACFICTAVAKGHARVVRCEPYVGPSGAVYRVNDQLRRLKALELLMNRVSPGMGRPCGGLEGHHFAWDSKGAGYEQFIDTGKARYGVSQGTVPVETFRPNGYGLYDMPGNVWEWCSDWYDSDWYKSFEMNSPDTRGPDSGLYRVARGGGWIDSGWSLRCAFRSFWHPSVARGFRGFRLAGGQVDAGFAELDEGGERTEAGRNIGAGR